MYLNNADNLEELTIYGIDPTLALMDLFEDEIHEILNPGSLEFIFWTEIKGKTLMMRERARDIIQVRIDKKNSRADKMERMLKSLESYFEEKTESPEAKIIGTNIKKVLGL